MTQTFIHTKVTSWEEVPYICTDLPIVSHDGVNLYLGGGYTTSGNVAPLRYAGYWYFKLNEMANVYGGSEVNKYAVLPRDVLMGYWKDAIVKGTNYFTCVLLPVTSDKYGTTDDFYAYTDMTLGPNLGEYVKPVKQFQIGTI